MNKVFVFLATLLLLNGHLYAGQILSKYFKPVPIDQAHVVYGHAKNLDLNPESIKVLVWNIKKTQEVPWETEFRKFAENKDLFLLQEAYDNERFLSTTASLSDVRWDMGKSFTYSFYDNHATGTMVGSTVDASEVLVTHTRDLEPVTGTPKSMVFSKYNLQGLAKKLLVISIHGINFTTFGTFKRNLLQAKEQILKHDGPVLLAGDFNSRTKQRLKHMADVMSELKFSTVVFKNGDQRMCAKLTHNILDHGFVRGLKVKYAEVFGSAKGSDHKPMALELAVDALQ